MKPYMSTSETRRIKYPADAPPGWWSYGEVLGAVLWGLMTCCPDGLDLGKGEARDPSHGTTQDSEDKPEVGQGSRLDSCRSGCITSDVVLLQEGVQV